MAYSSPRDTAHAPGGHITDTGHGRAEGSAKEQLAWLTAALHKNNTDKHRYVLLMRFTLFNLFGFSLLAAAWLHGLVDLVLVSDRTNLSVVIAVIFFAGLGLCSRKIWQTSRDLNQVRSFDPDVPSRAADYLALLHGRRESGRTILASTLRLKLSSRIGAVRHFANSLVILGLIGTVIGFIIALSGVDPENASDIKAVAPMISTLVDGMSTALYTTLVGSILNVWLMTNYHLLATGTVKLITALIEFGESHERT